MDMNEKPKLSGVPETMLQTVYARAKETKTRGAIKDTKAVEIIDKINYDFSLADKLSENCAKLIAMGINRAVHPALSQEDIQSLTC